MFVTLKKDYLGQKAGATLDVHEEPVAKSLIEQGIAEAVQGDPYGPLMARAVQSSVEALSRNLDSVINKALEEFARAQGKSHKGAVPALFGDQPPGDPNHCFGDFCLCVATGNRKRLEEHYQSAWVPAAGARKAPLGEASGSTGGYTVPPDFYRQLLALVSELAIFRPRAWVQPMASATPEFPNPIASAGPG
jgi:HK97 family phage major capsid protein